MEISNYTTFDLPVPYKKLMIYPITVRDYYAMSTYSLCLRLDKNSIPDPKIISMTELEYIYRATEEDPANKPYVFLFDRLLSLCLKDDSSFEDMEKSVVSRYKYNEKGKPFFTIEDMDYNSDDFEKIKQIIAKQNLIELIDENISKEVRDSLEEAREYKNRVKKPGSFEDYIVALSISTGWTIDYIYNMTVRKFLKSIKRMSILIDYKIYTQASVSGFVTFNDKSVLKHWLSDLDDENKYSDVSVDLEEIQDKVSFESAKK